MNIKKESAGLVADVDLYLTLDGKVVEESDPAANSLLSKAGTPIPEKLVQRLGINATGEQKKEHAAGAEEQPAKEEQTSLPEEQPEKKVEQAQAAAKEQPGPPDQSAAHRRGK